jgi:hypothetical protein
LSYGLFAPRLEKGASSYIEFIVPAEVLERHAVPRWRFQLMPWATSRVAYGSTSPKRNLGPEVNPGAHAEDACKVPL